MIETVLNNYWNGNLADAKKGAKRYSAAQITEYLKDMGYGEFNAGKIAAFLKGRGSFQEACDAEMLEKTKTSLFDR